MAKKKQHTADYLRIAKELRRWFPQLKKYAKRKSLSPAEKAAISRYKKTKASLELRDAIPITKAQAKSLGKRALAGGGMRAILVDGYGRDVKMRVRNGIPVLYSGNRTTNMVETEITQEAMWEAAYAIATEHKPRRVRFWLWNVKGRGKQGMSLDKLRERLSLIFARGYGGPVKTPDEYLKGLMYQVYTPEKGQAGVPHRITGKNQIEVVTLKRRKRGKRRGKKKA